MALPWTAAVRKTLDLIRGRKADFCTTFSSPAGLRTLAEIAKFCRANKSCFTADERETLMYEGRREVWLLIENYLRLSSEEMYALLNGSLLQREEGTDAA